MEHGCDSISNESLGNNNTSILIDRSRPFIPDPFNLFGANNRGIIIEEDARSLALTKIDLENIRLETMLEGNDKYVNGLERLRRLKTAGHIRLDALVFRTLMENQDLIPDRFKSKTICFDGTIIQYSIINDIIPQPLYINCHILCLIYRSDNDGWWGYNFSPINDGYGPFGTVSAVLVR